MHRLLIRPLRSIYDQAGQNPKIGQQRKSEAMRVGNDK